MAATSEVPISRGSDGGTAATSRAAEADTLLFHGSEDTIVPIEQSYLMDARLRANGVPVRMLVVKKGHAFTLYPDEVPDVR